MGFYVKIFLCLEILIAFSINQLLYEKIKKENTAVSLLRAFSYLRYFSIFPVTGNKLHIIWLDLIFQLSVILDEHLIAEKWILPNQLFFKVSGAKDIASSHFGI